MCKILLSKRAHIKDVQGRRKVLILKRSKINAKDIIYRNILRLFLINII